MSERIDWPASEPATTNGLAYSTIERIVTVPAMLFVPLLQCGHIAHCSTKREDVGEIGDRRRCLQCAEEAKR